MKKNNFIFSITLIIFLIIVGGCVKISNLSEFTDDITSEETPATPPMKIELSVSKAPALNDVTEITAKIWYTGKIKENMPETIAKIILPEGFELISGDLNWKGYVKNEPQQFNVKVKAIKIGNWTIEANARSPPTGRGYEGGRDWIYVSVLEDNGIVSEKPFPLPKREGSDMATDVNDSEILLKPPIDKNMITPKPIIQTVINTD